MRLTWPNGVLNIGRIDSMDAWGVYLAWGRRDFMGETVETGAPIFADTRTLILATGRDIRLSGGLVPAIVDRARRKVYNPDP